MGRHLTCSGAISCFLSMSPHHTSRLCDVVKLIGNCINTCDQKTPRARLRAKLLATLLCQRCFPLCKGRLSNTWRCRSRCNSYCWKGHGQQELHAEQRCDTAKRVFSLRHVHSVHYFSPGGTVSRNTVHNAHTDLYVGVVLPAAPNGHKIMVFSSAIGKQSCWPTTTKEHCDTGPCEDYGMHDPVLAIKLLQLL